MKSAARSFMDTKKLVAHVNAARGLFEVVGVGAFDALQSTTPRASAATKAPSKGKSTSPSKSQWSCEGKSEDKPDSRRPSLAVPPDVQWSDERRSCARTKSSSHNWTVLVVSPNGSFCAIVQIADHVTKIPQISNVLVRDETTQHFVSKVYCAFGSEL